MNRGQPGRRSSSSPGQTLSFGYLEARARAYIAVSGGVDVPTVLGSRSTYALGSLGGFEGRNLKAGDVIKLGEAFAGRIGAEVKPTLRSCEVGGEAMLRVVTGLYWHRLTDEAGANFFEDVWKVAPEADRIGYRFRGGRPLSFVDREQPFGAGSDPSNVVDCGYAYGSVQVPAGLEPIVLHRDAVSGGGYFMLGTGDLRRHGSDWTVAAAPESTLPEGRNRSSPVGSRC